MEEPKDKVEGEVTPLGEVMANMAAAQESLQHNLGIIDNLISAAVEEFLKHELKKCRNITENMIYDIENVRRVVKSKTT